MRVDIRVARASASLTPGDNTDQGTRVIDNRTASVTLVGVLAALGQTSVCHAAVCPLMDFAKVHLAKLLAGLCNARILIVGRMQQFESMALDDDLTHKRVAMVVTAWALNASS